MTYRFNAPSMNAIARGQSSCRAALLPSGLPPRLPRFLFWAGGIGGRAEHGVAGVAVFQKLHRVFEPLGGQAR